MFYLCHYLLLEYGILRSIAVSGFSFVLMVALKEDSIKLDGVATFPDFKVFLVGCTLQTNE